MTGDEFNAEFVPKVLALAPQMADYMKSEDVIQLWGRSLQNIPLDLSVKAVEAMVSGERPTWKARTDFIVRVQVIAREMAKLSGKAIQRRKPRSKIVRTDNGLFDDTFTCLLCEDEGTITTIHPDVIAKRKRGVSWELVGYPYQVLHACGHCQFGIDHSRGKEGLPFYDPKFGPKIPNNPRNERIRKEVDEWIAQQTESTPF